MPRKSWPEIWSCVLQKEYETDISFIEYCSLYMGLQR